jgi:hypothetical protein
MYFPGVESRQDMTLTPHPFLVPSSKNRAIRLLSLRTFMACKRGETYLEKPVNGEIGLYIVIQV